MEEFEQTPGDSEGQESLVCCGPWGCKESDTDERLDNNHWLGLCTFPVEGPGSVPG